MPEAKPVTIAIARFEDLVAHGLRALVDSDPHVRLVAWDVDHRQLGVVVRAHRPQVVLINFGSLESPVEVRALRSAYPETQLVLLANHPSSAECAQMLAFGASACLGKSTQARDVLNAIHLASRGLQLLPASPRSRGAAQGIGSELLTPREAEVLELLRQARPNAQIAASLQITVETVRTHARNIYRKLGVTSRRDLLAPVRAVDGQDARRARPLELARRRP
jgi:DNA-binding NarL/FixJ family response regulator